jgi:hypothetical protein
MGSGCGCVLESCHSGEVIVEENVSKLLALGLTGKRPLVPRLRNWGRGVSAVSLLRKICEKAGFSYEGKWSGLLGIDLVFNRSSFAKANLVGLLFKELLHFEGDDSSLFVAGITATWYV